MKVSEAEMRNFFSHIVYRNMNDIDFEHWVIHEFLTDLLASFLRVDKKGFFDIRKDQPVCFKLYKNRIEETKAMAENLLFVIGVFPESLVNIRNRRAVGLDYYIAMEARMITTMSSSSFIWSEIASNFRDTILTLNGVKSSIGGFVKKDVIVMIDVIRGLNNPHFLL